jgi:hypothetical protein
MSDKEFFYSANKGKYLNEDGSYDSIEPSDFQEYMTLIESGNATEQHHVEFGLRLINHFASSVYSEQEPDRRVMVALANIFSKISQGGRWEDELSMPWSIVSSPFSPADKKDLDIFCQIGNKFMPDKSQNITSIIAEVAELNNVSFEKARAAWYGRRSLLFDKGLLD